MSALTNLKAKIITLGQKMLAYNYKIDNGQDTYATDLSQAVEDYCNEKITEEGLVPPIEETDPVFETWKTNTPPAYPGDGLSTFSEDANHRVVTDVEKADWNSKSDGTHNHNLNDLTEKSYNSLTDVPDLSSLHSHSNIADLDNVSGNNTGDETTLSILTKIGNGALIDSTYLPSYVDDIIEGYLLTGVFYEDGAHTIPITGETGKIYVDIPTNFLYRYSGSAYINISNPLDYSTDIEADKLSTTKVSAIKTLYDWATGLFAKLTGGNIFAGSQNFDSKTLFIDGTNHKVGIGIDTNSFSSMLTVKAAPNTNCATFMGTNGYQILSFSDLNAANRAWVGNSTGSTFEFKNFVSGGNLLLTTTGGKVGIDTNTPATKLDVNGTSNFRDDMNILSTKYQYIATSPTVDTVDDIRVKNDGGILKTERCTIANATKGGGTWVDESKADITPANGSTSALRALFIARGYDASINTYHCVYNTNTGYYEMNGLTDITEAEMMCIYSASYGICNINMKGVASYHKCRTLYPVFFFSNSILTLTYMTNFSSTLVNFRCNESNSIVEAIGTFYNCVNLVDVQIITVSSITNTALLSNLFWGCAKLETAKIKSLKVAFSFAWSPLLSLASLQYLITNRANGTTRITITVHATVWGYLNDSVNYPEWNALWVDAVATQYIDFASA